MKFKKGNITVEETNPLLYNVWGRMGFKEVTEVTLDEMKQALKDAGVEFHHKLGAEKVTELYNELA